MRTDSLAKNGLLVGIAIILQPWWSWGLKVGFFLTAAATVLHILTSHRLDEADPLD
tara:strand:- start:2221 stop:2388 length:168 start_codon:yes stop_codon:yes gene_type:complete